MESQKKPVNDIRVGFNSRIGGLVNYCEKLLKENNIRELNFSAVGGSIGTLVSAVEVLKTLHAGFYQVNRFATISYQSVEEGKKGEVQNQRLYPKLEVKLTLDKPAKTGGEGYQEPLDEEERKKLLDIQSKRREGRGPRRGFRGRGRGRGRGRFRRGPGFRGRRGGFRGGRGRGRPMRGGRGRPPMRGRGRGGRGRPTRGRGRGAPSS